MKIRKYAFPVQLKPEETTKKPNRKSSIERIFENAFFINRLRVKHKRWATRFLKSLTAANCLTLRTETEMYHETLPCLARLRFNLPVRITGHKNIKGLSSEAFNPTGLGISDIAFW